MKKFIVKLIIFLLIVLNLHLLLYAPTGIDVPKNILLTDMYIANQPEIIYLGDSSLFTSTPQDKDKRSIPEMLQELLPQYSMGSIMHEAYNMSNYLHFCRYMIRKEYRPKIVIVPITMRTFSPHWDMRPSWQFEKEKLFLLCNNSVLLHIFYKPLAILKLFQQRITQYDFDNTPVFNGDRPAGRIIDYINPTYATPSEQNIKNKLILRYMFPLSARHRKMKSLIELATLLKIHDIQILFYIPPIDYQTGEQYLSGAFRERMVKNTSLVKSLLAGMGVEVLDLSFSLESDSFSWRDDSYPYPNEHLREASRQFIAQQLSQTLQKYNP